ncbi:MobA/MobL family protein [Stenotrophomonas maltophilia]|uniref:MobA/MobL family protein n=1 Tax=Stenotrophomonas maltophilia TaxID=40324 RepID=UPI00131173D8|nr:MobA/MobL family protein [Stenotrophomonas maltophilia]WME83652.1 MobA/MobL family protein [Stenotrophomonas maltophilia]
MAIFHAAIKVFSRGKGQSAVAAAAYRGGLLLSDVITGQQHDYRRRSGVVETFCLAPPDAPDWALVPGELWPVAEAAERRKDATVAREFELSLPHELSDEQRAHLAFSIAEALVDRYQFAIQASIHSPGTPDGLNHHVHLLASTRRIGPDGFGEKTRELDGGVSGKVQVQWVREMVAETTNAHLEAAGLTVTIDHRSLAEQARAASDRGNELQAAALSREPTKHLGKAATALSRKGMGSRLVAENDAIEAGNVEHLDHLTMQAGHEGRAVPMRPSVGHGPGGRPPSIQGLAPGLAIRGVSGMRLPQVLGPQHEATEGQRAVSLAERVSDALRDLQDIARARADLSIQRIRAGLEWVQAELARAGETVPLRQWITKAVLQVRALRAAILGRALRLVSLGRAERLCHVAQHEWERFNTDYPIGTNGYSRPEWTQRRERRLAALEQRTTELEKARLRGSAEALAEVDADILRKAEELEAMPSPPQFFLERQVAPSVAADSPVPVLKPRSPSLH